MEDKTKTEDQHQIEDEPKEQAQAETPVNQAETVNQAQTPVNRVGNERSWLSRSTRWSLFVRARFPEITQAATVVIGIAAVVISLATLCVVAVQAWIYDEQRKMMVEQMDITKRSERAYVGVESLDADFENRSVVVLLQNVGRIPASAVNVQLIEIRQVGDSSLGSLNRHAYKTQEIFGTLKMRISLKLDEFQPSELEDITTKKEKEGIRIIIQYHDGFDTAETKITYQFVGPASNNWIVLPD